MGQAETALLYADFNLAVPRVPFIARVDDEATLKLNFVAYAVNMAKEA